MIASPTSYRYATACTPSDCIPGTRFGCPSSLNGVNFSSNDIENI